LRKALEDQCSSKKINLRKQKGLKLIKLFG